MDSVIIDFTVVLQTRLSWCHIFLPSVYGVKIRNIVFCGGFLASSHCSPKRLDPYEWNDSDGSELHFFWNFRSERLRRRVSGATLSSTGSHWTEIDLVVLGIIHVLWSNCESTQFHVCAVYPGGSVISRHYECDSKSLQCD